MGCASSSVVSPSSAQQETNAKAQDESEAKPRDGKHIGKT